jgi:hypothetical protein
MPDPSPQMRMRSVANLFCASSMRRAELVAIIAAGRPGTATMAPSGPGYGAAQAGPPPAPDPFSDVIDSISGAVSGGVARMLPPATRYMVRVASVEPVRRKTKRDYDYFTELHQALASRTTEHRLRTPA